MKKIICSVLCTITPGLIVLLAVISWRSYESYAPAWHEPGRIESHNGVLETTLTAAKTGNTLLYNGDYPSKTLVVSGGDTMKIKLVNETKEPTNLHFHGAHVSPKGHSDNVFADVKNGESFQYEYDLPGSHPPGLYWYHPHWDPQTEDQVQDGMAGAIIVKGDIDELPGIKGLPERLLVLTSQTAADNNPNTPVRLVNGQTNPTLSIRPGQTQRWRILNASADDFTNFALSGQTFYIISRDGNTTAEPIAETTELMAPGDRIEILVTGPEVGSYPVQALAFDEGFIQYSDTTFMTMKSEGWPVFFSHIPDTLLPFEDLRNVPVDNTRTLTFTIGGTDDNPTFLLDGQMFDMNRVDQTITLGTTEEWNLVNNSDEVHPFHIHVNPFQVVEVNGQPVDRHGYDDTFPVPAHGSMKMKTRYTDFDGKFVLHCHILFHEDHGMMQVIRIVDPANPDASLQNSDMDNMDMMMPSTKGNDHRGRRLE